jgi:hypothetical protein
MYTAAAVFEKGEALQTAMAAYEKADATVQKYKAENQKLVPADEWPDEQQMQNGAARKLAREEWATAREAYQDINQRFSKAQEDYRALPEEADALAVGDAVEKALAPPAPTPVT